MQVAKGGSRLLTRYYLGDCYEIDETPSGNKEKLYLAGENYYDASAVLVKDHTNSWKLYYIGRDYLEVSRISSPRQGRNTRVIILTHGVANVTHPVTFTSLRGRR